MSAPVVNQNVVRELKRIAKENRGILMPVTVVDAARPKSSPLHSRFEWDDKVAGHSFRLHQARQLISITVDVIRGTEEQAEVFVSLSSDRKGNRGGYRIVADVMSDAQLRKQLLDDALAELESFRNKYQRLKELTAIFQAIKKLRSKNRKKG